MSPGAPWKPVRSVRVALVCLVLATPIVGCIHQAGRDAAEAHPLIVYLENDSRPQATFDVEIQGRPTVRVSLPATGSAPNVKQAYNGTVEHPEVDVTVTLAETGASAAVTGAWDSKNFVVAELYQDGTIEVWLRHTQPLFD